MGAVASELIIEGLRSRAKSVRTFAMLALTHAAHVHHPHTLAWFGSLSGPSTFATCAHTQLALLRLACMPGVGGASSPAEATQALQQLCAHPRHCYWADSPAPVDVDLLHNPALTGHRQITDA